MSSTALVPYIDIEEPSSSETNEGKKILDEYRALCGPLLEAAMKGDWPGAKAFLEKHPDCFRLPITKQQATALHSAAAAKRTNFVEELLKLMTREDLELTTLDGDTALHVAAQTGVVGIAKEMVKKNNQLPLINKGEEMIPLHVAVYQRDRDMVDYLFSDQSESDSVTPFPRLTTRQRINLFLRSVSAGFYDIALKILDLDPSLATAVDTADTTCGWKALEELAKEPFAIGGESRLSLWKSRLNSCVMKENITNYIAKRDKDELHIAEGDNMLHMAGRLAPSDRLNTISIAALQMQKELLWFQNVEKIVPPSYMNMKNSKGETPKDIFKREHKDLQEKGEKWMKETANNCMLVATLIATVVFAAAFTVPGGNNQEARKPDTRKPLLLNSN